MVRNRQAAGRSRAVVALALLFLLLGFSGTAFADHAYLSEAEAPHAMFASNAIGTRKVLALSDSELDVVGKALGHRIEVRRYAYLEVSVDRRIVGTIFLLDVLGQAQPITFAVAVTPEGVVQDVRVMVYRESHGEEIENHRFHHQFQGKTAQDPIALGKDVDAISGATISSRSEAVAVRKALRLAEVLRHREKTP